MKAHGGLITREDLKGYQAKKRDAVRGTYRGYEIIGMPPTSSGGIALVEMLNILEGYDLQGNGYGSAQNMHLIAESMRRAFADRAQLPRRSGLQPGHAARSADLEGVRGTRCARRSTRTQRRSRRRRRSPGRRESPETTHLSIVDAQRNAVSMTYTLEPATARASSCPAPASC